MGYRVIDTDEQGSEVWAHDFDEAQQVNVVDHDLFLSDSGGVVLVVADGCWARVTRTDPKAEPQPAAGASSGPGTTPPSSDQPASSSVPASPPPVADSPSGTVPAQQVGPVSGSGLDPTQGSSATSDTSSAPSTDTSSASPSSGTDSPTTSTTSDSTTGDPAGPVPRGHDRPAGAVTTFSISELPSDPATWPRFRKVALTSAIKIDGPFTVDTSEGPLTCQDGYLAVDARGYPYPIATDEFELIYEPVT